MATPDGPDDGHIADTGMFQRFVAYEQEMDAAEQPGNGAARWTAIAVAVAIVVIAVVVWLVLR